MGDDVNAVLTQFQNISSKLKKKRILKKPNVSEAYEQFENLGNRCDREELPQFAGLCYQNAAKCQNSLGNNIGESFMLLKAARKYVNAETYYSTHGIVSTEECLQNALHCFNQSAERFEENREANIPSTKCLAGGVMIETGNALYEKKKLIDAAEYYRSSIQIFDKSPIEKIHSLQLLATCKIELGEYDEALNVYTRIMDTLSTLPKTGFQTDCLREAEITRLLLFLILQPTAQQLTSATASVLEKYAWVETQQTSDIVDLKTVLKNNGLSMFTEDTFICLQSLVMACQSNDTDSLELLQNELTKYLNKQQRILFKVLFRKMSRK